MFLGQYYHSLEAKGRLAIPSSFRKDLGVHPILTRGLDGCLFLVPRGIWQKFTGSLRGSPLTRHDTRTFIRLVAHQAHHVTFDAQGRIRLPLNLRDYAGIKKTTVIAGSLDWVEIWDRDRYHREMQKAEKQADQVAERLAMVAQEK